MAKKKKEEVCEPKSVKAQIADKMTILITSAFGLVAALAWNDTIKAIFNAVFGSPNTIGPMLAYAIIVTVIAVILTLMIAKMGREVKE